MNSLGSLNRLTTNGVVLASSSSLSANSQSVLAAATRAFHSDRNDETAAAEQSLESLYQELLPTCALPPSESKDIEEFQGAYIKAKEQILNDLKQKLSNEPEEKKLIDSFPGNVLHEEFLTKLLLRAEVARRSGKKDLQDVFVQSCKELHTLYRLFGAIESGIKVSAQEFRKVLNEELSEIYKEENFGALDETPQVIQREDITLLLNKILPKSVRPEDRFKLQISLLHIVNAHVEACGFGKTKRLFLPENQRCTVKEEEGVFPFYVAMHIQSDGVTVTCSFPREKYWNEKGNIREIDAMQIWIPKDPMCEKVTQRVRICFNADIRSCQREEIGFSRIERFLGSEKDLFEQKPEVYELGTSLKSKGVDSFAKELQKEYSDLSVLDYLGICWDVVKQVRSCESANLVLLSGGKPHVYFRKKGEHVVRGFLDNMDGLKSPSTGQACYESSTSALDQKGLVLPEVDRYHLVRFLCSVHGFSESKLKGLRAKELIEGSWVDHLVSSLESSLSSELYDGVLELVDPQGDGEDLPSPKELADALFDYTVTNSIKMSDNEYAILMRCAHKIAVVPLLIDLLIKAEQANTEQKVWLNSQKDVSMSEIKQFLDQSKNKIPSFQEIEDCLKNIEKEIDNVGKVPPTPNQAVSAKQADSIVESLCKTREVRIKEESVVKDLQSVLTKSFQSSKWKFFKGLRLSKQDTKLPFSCRVQKAQDGVTVDVISKETLCVGGFKKVKKMAHFFLPKAKNAPMGFNYAVLSRSDGHRLEKALSGMKEQFEILSLPGAEGRFLPLPIIHTTHGCGGRKIEFSEPRYSGDLFNAIHGGIVKDFLSEKREKVSSSELIDSLKNVLDALEIMHRAGFTHGDFKLENVLLAIVNGILKGYVADFDFTKKDISVGRAVADIWPALRQEEGVLSKEVDLYGLGLLMGFIFLPQDFSLIGNQSPDRKKRIYQMMIFNPRQWKEYALREEMVRIQEAVPPEKKVLFDRLSQHISGMQPFALVSEEGVFDSLFQADQASLKKDLESILSYAQELKEQGNHDLFKKIEKFVVHFIILDPVLNLVRNTLAADQTSQELFHPIHRSKVAPLYQIISVMQTGKSMKRSIQTLEENIGNVLSRGEMNQNKYLIAREFAALSRRIKRYSEQMQSSRSQDLQNTKSLIEEAANKLEQLLQGEIEGISALLSRVVTEVSNPAIRSSFQNFIKDVCFELKAKGADSQAIVQFTQEMKSIYNILNFQSANGSLEGITKAVESIFHRYDLESKSSVLKEEIKLLSKNKVESRKNSWVQENLDLVKQEVSKASKEMEKDRNLVRKLQGSLEKFAVLLSKAEQLEGPSNIDELKQEARNLAGYLKIAAGKEALEKASFPQISMYRQFLLDAKKVAEIIQERGSQFVAAVDSESSYLEESVREPSPASPENSPPSLGSLPEESIDSRSSSSAASSDIPPPPPIDDEFAYVKEGERRSRAYTEASLYQRNSSRKRKSI